MSELHPSLTRRSILRGGIALGVAAQAAFSVRGAFAEELSKTPRLTEGPFYPPKLPLDTDNDLLIINDSITPAVGEVTHLTGKILSPTGEPMQRRRRDLAMRRQRCLHRPGQHEWKRHPFPGLRPLLDQLHGRILLPHDQARPYPGRTPHIHVKVKQGGKELLTTQIFINGHAR